MESKESKQELITRLACCVVAALILYYGVDKMGDKLKVPLLDQYRPWLEQNKVQAIAIAEFRWLFFPQRARSRAFPAEHRRKHTSL